jgi:hypothetical protein
MHSSSRVQIESSCRLVDASPLQPNQCAQAPVRRRSPASVSGLRKEAAVKRESRQRSPVVGSAENDRRSYRRRLEWPERPDTDGAVEDCGARSDEDWRMTPDPVAAEHRAFVTAGFAASADAGFASRKPRVLRGAGAITHTVASQVAEDWRRPDGGKARVVRPCGTPARLSRSAGRRNSAECSRPLRKRAVAGRRPARPVDVPIHLSAITSGSSV